MRSQKGPINPNWQGGRHIEKGSNGRAYWLVWVIGHPRANSHNCVLEHRLMAEASMGMYLPKGAVVHHVDGNGLNNKGINLVVCESESYHKILHRRARAKAVTGNVHARKCTLCKEWDDPKTSDLRVYKMARGVEDKAQHLSCHSGEKRRLREGKNEKGEEVPL